MGQRGDFVVRTYRDAVVVRPTRDLDDEMAGALDAVVDAALSTGARTIVLDLVETANVTRSASTAVCRSARRARASGQAFVLRPAGLSQ